MPNILYIRPADGEETAGAWITAIETKTAPTIISLSRHALPQLDGTRRDAVAKGGYVFSEIEGKADLTLISCGSELNITVSLAALLKEKHSLKVRVVSMPCQRLFIQQSREYQRSVLKRGEGIPAVVVEAYSAMGWERFADAGVNMHSFGHSLPGAKAYDYFGFTAPKIAPKVVGYLESLESGKNVRGEWVDL